jgi:hypothetical protein
MFQTLEKGALTAASSAGKMLTFPLEAIGAVTGAPQRAVSGMIGHNPNDNPFGSAAYEVFHPSQEAQFSQQGEHVLGMDTWFKSLGNMPGNTPVSLPLMMPTGAPIVVTNTADQWKQMGRDFIYENLTDPMNLFFGVGAARRVVGKLGEKAYQGLAEGIPKVAEAVGGPAGKSLVNALRVAPHLKAALRPRAASTAMAMENGAHNTADAMQSARDALVAKIKAEAAPWHEANANMQAAIESGDPQALADATTAREKVPVKPSDVLANNQAEVRRLLNEDAYVLGAPHVRAQALAHGFAPSPAQAAEPALNILGGYRDEYLPNKSWFNDLPEAETDVPETLATQSLRPGVAGFTKHRFGPDNVPEEDLIPTLETRFQKGVQQVRRHLGKERVLSAYAPKFPQLQRTQAAIAAERAAAPGGSSPRLDRLMALRDKQVAKIHDIEKRLGGTNRPGQEPVSLDDFLRKRQMTAMSPGAGALRVTAWRQALRNLGLTPANMKKMGLGVSPMDPFSRPHDVTGALRFANQATKASEKAQRIAEESARAEGRTQEGVTGAVERGGAVQTALQAKLAKYAASKIAPTEAKFEAAVERHGESSHSLGHDVVDPLKAKMKALRPTKEVAAKIGETGAKAEANTAKMQAVVRKKLSGSLTLARRAAARADKAKSLADKAQAEVARREAYNEAWNAVNEAATNIVRSMLAREVPADLAEHIFPKPQKFTGIPLLKGLSEAVRQQYFANPAVHGIKNEGTLAVLGEQGFKGAIEGIAIAAGAGGKEKYAADVERLKAMGASSNMTATPTDVGPLVTAAAKIAKPAKAATSKLDLGQRIAALHWLDTTTEADPLTGKLYKDMTDFEKAGVINDTQFEYQHTSQASKVLRSVGAPFPHWHMAVVSTMLRQMLKRPWMVNLIARIVNEFNADVLKDKPYKLEPGLPMEDPVKLLGASYYVNSGGPITETLKVAADKQLSLGQKAGTVLYNQEPYLRMIGEPLGVSPFHPKATAGIPPAATGAAELWGAYFRGVPKP